MKKLVWLIVLTALCLACTIAGCSQGKTPSFTKSENKIGEDYVVKKTYPVKLDEGINFDGVLDEEIWQQSKAMTYRAGDNYLAAKGRAPYGPTAISIKTHFTEDNLYLGMEVEDKVLYGPNVALWQESGLELLILGSPTYSIDLSKQVRFCASGVTDISYRDGSNFRLTSGRNLGEAVVIHGDGLNTTNNTGYTVEGVISWKDIGLDECPEVIAINPILIRVQNIPSTAGGQSYYWDDCVADYTELEYANPKTWWKFDKDGAIIKNTIDFNAIIAAGGEIDGENIITAEGGKVSLLLTDPSNEKRGYDVRAKLSKYGLYVEAEVRSNNIPKYFKIEFFKGYWQSESNNGREDQFFSTSGGNTPTWKDIQTVTVPSADIATTGYAYKTTYRLFFSWEYLTDNVDITACPGYNAEHPEESTLYINPVVHTYDGSGTENKEMIGATYYKFSDGSVTGTSSNIGRWRILNDYSAISADSKLYRSFAVKKTSGIAWQFDPTTV